LEDKNFKTYNLYPNSTGGYQTKISVPILMAPQRPLWYFDTTAHFVARYANDGATRYYYKGPMKVADIDPSKLDTYWYEISSSNVLYKVGNNYEISYIDEHKNWVPHISAAKFDTTGALLTDAYDMDLVNFFISGTSGSTDIYYVSGDGSRETHWTRFKNQKKIFDTEQEVMTKYNSLDSNAKRYLSPVPTFDLKDNYKFFYLDYFSATNFNETGDKLDIKVKKDGKYETDEENLYDVTGSMTIRGKIYSEGTNTLEVRLQNCLIDREDEFSLDVLSGKEIEIEVVGRDITPTTHDIDLYGDSLIDTEESKL
jgi:hypothetical protein